MIHASEPAATAAVPVPILALDVPGAAEAHDLLGRVPEAGWVKVGLQLFVAEGPRLVRDLKRAGRQVFLDLKFHDIPNTVARAVASAARLEVDLVTLHASGGRAMLEAARAAVPASGGPQLLAVTVLTSLSAAAAAEAWGRERVETADEVVRLAELAAACGIDGVVAAVHEAEAARSRAGRPLLVLTPGIRLAGDGVGDQARVATPEQAARAGVDFMVIGRTVTAAPDPRAAWARVVQGILRGAGE